MALLNVRLNPEDARKAKALRGAGVPLSTVVRNAIRAEYDRRRFGAEGTKKPSEVVAHILRAIPDPGDLPPRGVDAADRRAVRRHVAARLMRRKP